MRRAIVLVMDGCGAGAAPDHADFGDGPEVATLKNTWNAAGGINAPCLIEHGLFAAAGVGDAPNARFGRLRERSKGKDSVTGHWEMMGIETKKAFPTYPQGFPSAVMQAFEAAIGRGSLANCAASGTAIIEQFGEEHLRTGKPIVYTSADSVFQIAAHEQAVPLEQLYKWCQEARRILTPPNDIQRVIARPFIGVPGAFIRTGNRRDFPLEPPPNFVDAVGDVFGIGVVPELFDHRGFRSVRRTQNNAEHAAMLAEAMESDARFIFGNFEDFDMLYGHRNDAPGFAKALEVFDKVFNQVVGRLRAEDLLLLTADHGNDPTDVSTDHTREFVPVCLVGSQAKPTHLGDVDGMGCIAATVAKHLGVDWDSSFEALI